MRVDALSASSARLRANRGATWFLTLDRDLQALTLDRLSGYRRAALVAIDVATWRRADHGFESELRLQPTSPSKPIPRAGQLWSEVSTIRSTTAPLQVFIRLAQPSKS
jgi:hypothetical protein